MFNRGLNNVNNKKNISWQPVKVSSEDRYQIMNQWGQVVWLTGLSGAGKSTIAVELEKTLLLDYGKAAYCLDGDNIRHGLNNDLGFSPGDRDENIRRIAEVAALFKDAGIITIVSFISPYRQMREFARRCVGDQYFKEVYVKADLTTCLERDPKGLYKKALDGEIKNFTGISAPYQEPQNPELIVDTTSSTIKESVTAVLSLIML